MHSGQRRRLEQDSQITRINREYFSFPKQHPHGGVHPPVDRWSVGLAPWKAALWNALSQPAAPIPSGPTEAMPCNLWFGVRNLGNLTPTLLPLTQPRPPELFPAHPRHCPFCSLTFPVIILQAVALLQFHPFPKPSFVFRIRCSRFVSSQASWAFLFYCFETYIAPAAWAGIFLMPNAHFFCSYFFTGQFISTPFLNQEPLATWAGLDPFGAKQCHDFWA